MSDYKTAKNRLNKAKTKLDLERLDKSLARIYDAGVFTESEYQKLTVSVMVKMAKIGE